MSPDWSAASSRKRRYRNAIKHALLVLSALIMLYPLLWMLGSSFKTDTIEILRGASIFPANPTLDHYRNGLQGVAGVPFLRYFLNSFVLVGMVMFGTILSSSLTAFAFARLEFQGKRFLFSVMLLTIMLPFHAVLIPQYIIFNNLGWANTYLPLIVPRFFATWGFFIFLNVQFLRAIPRELDQAAYVDGCTPFQVYARVLLPLSVPSLTTTAIFSFIWTWNDFLGHLVYISEVSNYTVTLGLRLFLDAQSETVWGSVLAMSVLSLIPVFLLFVFFQRYLISGVTAGSLKG